MLTKSRLAAAPLSAVLPATDIGRARDFYERVLGLETETGPTPDSFMVHAGMGTQFLVYQTQFAHGDATVAAFIVENLDDVMRELRDRGLTFQDYHMPGIDTVNGVAEMDGARSAWFVDTEGNTVNIVQM